MRIGHGYDVHPMRPKRNCVFCGVDIPYDMGPDGHSDADVPVHALMDAILGAAALGDIGKLFPDSDERYLGADSMGLLRRVVELIHEKGYTVGNADVTIVAQSPKMSPYIERMRKNLARCLDVGVDRVSVKATTEEGFGVSGEGGIAAHAVVLLEETIR